MDPEETILQKIQEMGYLTVIPLRIDPSYYNIDNGTILKVYTLVNSLHPDPKNLKSVAVDSQDIILTFTPQSQRGEPSTTALTQKQLVEGILEEDVNVEPLRENFSTHSVSDGSTLSIKTIVGQVSKTKYFNREGVPIYIVNSSIVPKIKKTKKTNSLILTWQPKKANKT